ncbi:MAG TPA: membrane protein insertase YidC [Geminicoccaceae bacterium]|nr:membrane protein insertase YidC [Geminicoccaceae bacterium]
MPEQRNLILAIVLSVTIILAFQYFYELPRLKEAQQRATPPTTTEETATPAPDAATVPAPAVPGDAAAPVAPPGTAATTRETVLADAPRVRIDNGRLHGSIDLRGARLDDLTLADYHVEPDPRSPEIVLLSPAGAPGSYFAEFGWVATEAGVEVPGRDAVWRAGAERLTPDQPVELSWENGQGLRFVQTVQVDRDFVFTVAQRVENAGDEAVTLHPYGLISRWGTPPTMGFFILHEGLIGVVNDTLTEIDYGDVRDSGEVAFDSQGGWLGFTDKYWLTALLPDQDPALKATFRHTLRDGDDRYQTDFLRPAVTVPAGGSVEVVDRLFAGAKEVNLLDRYGEQFGLPLFDRAVDFGWFYFLTKPLFQVLTWLYAAVGNFGVAILILTVIVKLIFFPLANKSYRAMTNMKKLQPKMMELREQFGDDKMRLNQELMALYKREKVNPVSGCLPIVVQIPVFFALYKVLFVSIEMRHAPFFGWINDLSAPDPTSLFNLFGVIPWDPPHLLMVGAWPILMGGTMFLQQKLNPQPADPMQARIMMLLPLMFTFLFATFPAGLVIYWTWNNILSIAQQWVIMRRAGVSV